MDAFHQTVQDLFEEEEDLLNMHMSVIQENAELLTEEVTWNSFYSQRCQHSIVLSHIGPSLAADSRGE